MLAFLEHQESVWGPLRIFGYLTFRTLMGAATALLLGWVLGPWFISRLRRLKLAHAPRADVEGITGPNLRKRSTPSMGGLLIFTSVTVSVLLWAEPNVWVLTALVVYAGLTLVGLRDDWLKVSRQNPRGLPSRWKLAAQSGLTVLVLALLALHPDSAPHLREIHVTFLKDPVLVGAPLLAVGALLFFVLVGSSNAINLTDGLDGLAIGCTITAAIAFGIMSYAAGNAMVSRYLLISYVPGTGELAVVCGALVGAGLAFLWYNAHPAEVFMGDTGSLALGGIIGSIAFMIHQPFTLVIVGGIFVLEALSVIIQVVSFQTTGRRVFLMSPIHHHFQKAGWDETKVVVRFWIVSLVCAFAGLGTLKLR